MCSTTYRLYWRQAHATAEWSHWAVSHVLTILADVTHRPQQRVDTLSGGEGHHPAVRVVAMAQFAPHFIRHVPQWQCLIFWLHKTCRARLRPPLQPPCTACSCDLVTKIQIITSGCLNEKRMLHKRCCKFGLGMWLLICHRIGSAYRWKHNVDRENKCIYYNLLRTLKPPGICFVTWSALFRYCKFIFRYNTCCYAHCHNHKQVAEAPKFHININSHQRASIRQW